MTLTYWTQCRNEKKRFFFWSWRSECSDLIKKIIFYSRSWRSERSNQIIFFPFDHDVVNVAKKWNKEFSWSWHGEVNRRRWCSRKIKVVKVKIILFLSESRCSECSSSDIKICNFSRSWRSKQSGKINFIINKKNNVFCFNQRVVNLVVIRKLKFCYCNVITM